MTIKRYILFFLLQIFLYANATTIFTPKELNYLKEKKKIKLCFSPKGLPLFGYENGKNVGILPDVMHLIEENIPIPFHYVNVKNWEECVELSQRKKVDIAGVIVQHPNMHSHLTPSVKIIEAFVGIATRIDEPFFNEFNNLEGNKVAFLKGQVSVKSYVMKKYPHIESVMVDSIKEGLDMVAQEKVYGYADETYSLAYHILNLYSNELKIIERINSKPIAGSIGVSKSETTLLNIINKSIASIDEKNIRNIIQSWITVKVENSFNTRLLLELSVLFVLFLFASLFWIGKLSKEVKARRSAEEKLRRLNEHLETEVSNKVNELHYKDTMLLEKTKLEAMGEMLGSIAHQWRRPLSSLHINIELLETEYHEDKINKKFLQHFIEKNNAIIQFMSQTIDDFQNFYKVDKAKSSYDVLEAIKSVAHLHLDYLSTDNISLYVEGESVLMYGYKNELQQVILNIINNAHDAHKSNKTIKPFIKIKVNVFSQDEQIHIEITDNAGGIKEDIIDKVFEANFTTKNTVRNVGLGLYISKMVIENNMQGHVSLSNKSDGCYVDILLKKDENE